MYACYWVASLKTTDSLCVHVHGHGRLVWRLLTHWVFMVMGGWSEDWLIMCSCSWVANSLTTDLCLWSRLAGLKTGSSCVHDLERLIIWRLTCVHGHECMLVWRLLTHYAFVIMGGWSDKWLIICSWSWVVNSLKIDLCSWSWVASLKSHSSCVHGLGWLIWRLIHSVFIHGLSWQLSWGVMHSSWSWVASRKIDSCVHCHRWLVWRLTHQVSILSG